MDLSDICKQYGLEDFTKKKVQMNNYELINKFTSGIDQSYYAYKQNANIDRALLKCKLKEKKLTKAQKNINELIDKEKEELRIREELKAKKA